jgi:alanine racemase
MTRVYTNRAIAEINLGAIEHNVRTLKAIAQVPLMVVVKADGYGHGAVPVALSAQSAGADWIGVCYLDEAFELRNSGVPGRILAWLLSADDDFANAVDEDIDLSVSTPDFLELISEVAKARGIRARVHLEVDTGMSRAGAPAADWMALFEKAVALEDSIEIVSLWSHLACADEPTHKANSDQQSNFERAIAAADKAGLKNYFKHLSNSAGTLAHPNFKYDLVRCGIALYGVTPGGDLAPAATYDLAPAMTLKTQVAQLRHLNPGDGVSYGHRWVAETATTVGLIPVGYADGIPRAATNSGHVTVNGKQFPIVGTVCMDQLVVDFGQHADIAVGQEVIVFGDAGMCAHDWAVAASTIGYELVTRIGERVQRVYVDSVG